MMLLAMTVRTGIVTRSPSPVSRKRCLRRRQRQHGRAWRRCWARADRAGVRRPKYLGGRLSATAPFAYNAAASSGSNLGPKNPALTDALKQSIDALHAADPGNTAPVPVDLVTASGSGLDPQISPAAAQYQLARVAHVRGLSATDVEKLVAQATQGRQFGVLGEPRVNVLELNLLLDARW